MFGVKEMTITIVILVRGSFVSFQMSFVKLLHADKYKKGLRWKRVSQGD